MISFSHSIADLLQLKEVQVRNTLSLLDEKATIPFIARYRKEKTGGLDEVQIAAISEQYSRLQELEARKKTVLNTIEEQGKLTPELRKRIEACTESTELEDLYIPYKPHRKTRADMAIERGLLPLAEEILRQRPMKLPTDEAALQGARDIIAQRIAEDERSRNAIRREFRYTAQLTTKVVKDKADTPEAQNYREYFNVCEPLRRISSHRLLAIRRAESEGFIRVDISPDSEKALDKLATLWLHARNDTAYQVELAMEDGYKRLLKPAIETEFAAASKEKADTEAIRVFADNLRQLLLDAPLGQKRVLAFDPGFRTGCKVVMLSAQGDLVYHTVVYLHKMDCEEQVSRLIAEYKPEAIAIGNGTASRETEQMVRKVVERREAPAGKKSESPKPKEAIPIFVVSESGASVYSASKVGREEFPDEDVTVRGAVSIGRRLMDPLAELVKIEPKSIGVGQYQHDVDQTRLRESLQQTVESVVNYVGVDVNTASKHLLTYISGLGPTLAQNIVDYRSEHGPYPNRRSLMKVPKMGAKTYEQCAGFLRIAGGTNPLDNTAVHPERYALAEQMIRQLDRLNETNLQQFVTEDVGLPTLIDILHELHKPTRDPRTQAEEFHFSQDVHTIDDLHAGMLLPGIVTNLSAFGAFVDLGVHKDGLIHISEMSERRISSPSEVLRLHQKVEVRVLDVDRARGRIQLSLKRG